VPRVRLQNPRLSTAVKMAMLIVSLEGQDYLSGSTWSLVSEVSLSLRKSLRGLQYSGGISLNLFKSLTPMI
jgi:hypothetical protein